jgi:RNA polymerase sigma factor for flagellar operon FliA
MLVTTIFFSFKSSYVKEQNKELWERYIKNKNDDELRNELVVRYLFLVKKFAKQYEKRLGYHNTFDELVSSGTIGLMHAVSRFEPDRGCLFEAYAARRITGAMLDGIREMDWVPRLERTREKQGTLKNEVTKVISMFDVNTENSKVVDSAGAFESKEPRPERRLEQELWLQKMLRGLNAVERTIVISYYYKHKSMTEIGKDLHLSASRIVQIHAALLKRLRERYNISLDLELEDFRRYCEVRNQMEKRIASGKLSRIDDDSYVGRCPVAPMFTWSMEQYRLNKSAHKREKEKERETATYNVSATAKKWGTSWQLVRALQRAGVIPASEVSDTGWINAAFVDNASFPALLKRFQEAKEKAEKRPSSKKRKRARSQ